MKFKDLHQGDWFQLEKNSDIFILAQDNRSYCIYSENDSHIGKEEDFHGKQKVIFCSNYPIGKIKNKLSCAHYYFNGYSAQKEIFDKDKCKILHIIYPNNSESYFISINHILICFFTTCILFDMMGQVKQHLNCSIKPCHDDYITKLYYPEKESL